MVCNNVNFCRYLYHVQGWRFTLPANESALYLPIDPYEPSFNEHKAI